jgi:hypothetical protein
MSRMTAWGVMGSGPPRRRRGGAGAGGSPQTQAYDFTGAMPTAFDSAWAGPASYAAGYPTHETFASSLGVPAISGGKTVRRDARGLWLEPAVTNELTNPRMVGAVAATNGANSGARTIAIGAISATAGSNIFTITDAGHGLANGQRIFFNGSVTVGGRTFTSGSATAINYTIANVTTNTFDIVYWQAATSTGTNAASVNYQSYTIGAHTLPTGASIRDESSGARFIRLVGATNPAGPPYAGATRVYNVAGSGTAYLVHANLPSGAGQVWSFSQIAHVLVRRGGASDDQSLANFAVAVAIVERDSGNAILRETVIDQMAEMTVGISQMRMRATVTTGANCASIDVALKFTGALACDIQFELREMMASKTRHRASAHLPAVGATGSVSRVAETCAGVAAPWGLRGFDIAFESKEIVAATDVIASFGAVELRAVGLAFPRDLVLTDGTNSVTLSGALRDNWPTQQLVRASASFGATGGLRLSVCDDFVTAARVGSAVSFAGSAPTTINLNENASGGARGMIVVKSLTLHDSERSLADVTAASRLTFNAGFAVPGVDTAVGRTSVAGLTAPPASGSFAGGRMSISAGRVFILAPAQATTISDYDFRGTYILTNLNGVTDVTFSQCLFDLSTTVSTVAYAVSQNNLTGCSNWTFENCDFSVNNGTSTASAYFSMTSANPVFRRCRFTGSPADIVKFIAGGTVEDCILVMTNGTNLGAHADGLELGPTSLNELIARRILVDFRKVYGTRVEPNTALGGSPAAGVNFWSKAVTLSDMILLGGFNQVDMQTLAPSATSATLPGLYLADAQHALTNIKIAMATFVPVDIKLDGAQLRFSGAAVTFANVGGRAGGQNCVGLMAGAWPDGFRGGAIKTTGLAGPALTTTALNGLATPMAANDAFSINGNTITVLASGASGNNQINVTDTLATLITKMQALVPGLTVTLEPYRYTATGVADYFSGAAAA